MLTPLVVALAHRRYMRRRDWREWQPTCGVMEALRHAGDHKEIARHIGLAAFVPDAVMPLP